jgi:ligand-binding sensor domain-containing protein
LNRCWIIPALVFVFLCGITGKAQSILYRHFDVGTVAQQNAINCITSDPYGLIWAGTPKGLYDFDGTLFRSHTNDEALHEEITALHCMGEKLWNGFKNGKIGVRSIRIWKHEVEVDTVFQHAVTRIAGDAQQRTWVATYGSGLFIKEAGRWKNISVADGLPSAEIYCLALAADGTAWLGTDEGLTLCRYLNGSVQIQTFGTADGLSDQIVKSLCIDAEQKIWIGTYNSGIIRFDPAVRIFEPLPASKNWPYGPVTDIAIQSHRRLMAGTLNQGVISIDCDNLSHLTWFNERTGYADAKVTSVHLDAEGNFWITSLNNGLDLFPGLFQWLPLPVQSVSAVSYDLDKRQLWYASSDGFFRLAMDTSLPQKISLSSSPRLPIITCIHRDESKNIWVGTLDEGVFVLPEGKTPAWQFTEKNGLVNNSVLDISHSSGGIWFATLGGASFFPTPSAKLNRSRVTFENYSGENGLRSNYIYQVHTDAKGTTWFATDGDGLKYLESGQFKTIDRIDSFRLKTVYSLAEDRQGNLWFSTPASGIFRYDGKTFSHFDDITNLSVTGIVADVNNDILLIEEGGLEVYESSTGQIRRYLDRTFFEGIEPNINAYHADEFGNIWIATSKGILKYYPPLPSFVHQARLELLRVQVYLQPFDFMEQNRFAYNENHLTFDFQGFWNYNPSQIRYRYQLEGYDLDWVRTKDERVIYPNLPPGQYTFKVQATIHHNFNDVITRQYSFVIATPFWLTWWFIGLCCLSGGGIIFGFTRWREKQIEKEEALKRKNIEFQLENLKSQINPHFLFNSFNTLSTLIDEDQKLAVSFVENLSDFYRYTLKYRDNDLITVKEEKELTENYVFLLRQRHGESLKVYCSIALPESDYLIPPLTLQLLIENAVKHNVTSRERPLSIEVTSGDGKLMVSNNLQLKLEPVRSTRMGLQNISARFEILGGKPVEIKKTEEAFCVIVHLFKT